MVQAFVVQVTVTGYWFPVTRKCRLERLQGFLNVCPNEGTAKQKPWQPAPGNRYLFNIAD